MKNLKNIKGVIILIALTIICSCSVMLFSCGESEININLEDLAKVIGEKIDLSDTIRYSDDQINDYFGITKDDVAQIIMLKEMDVLKPEILILIEAKDKETATAIEVKLKKYKDTILNGLKDYAADAENESRYYMVEACEILVKQQYVFWGINPQNKEINDIINDYIKNNK